MLQIAAYDSIHRTTAASTPVQSTVVGGEEGGRAPYVLKGDAVGNAAERKKDDDTTSILANVPQPGHDIFAEQPVKDINSENRPVAPPPPKDEDKEVSKVVVAPGSQITNPPDEGKGKDGEEAAKDAKGDPAVHGEDKAADVKDQSSTSSKDAEEDKAPPQPQGPLPHDEAEAEMAREDLFPDAA